MYLVNSMEYQSRRVLDRVLEADRGEGGLPEGRLNRLVRPRTPLDHQENLHLNRLKRDLDPPTNHVLLGLLHHGNHEVLLPISRIVDRQ